MTTTLVISSYKYGHLASHAIESAFAQIKQFDKILFVDDGAKDCKHLIPLYRDRVDFTIRSKNLGTVDNFNDMLNKVETDYVMFLGADNWLRSDALDLLHEQLPADIVTYDIMVTGELRNDIYKNYSNSIRTEHGDFYWKRPYQHHGSMLYNVRLAKSLGGYQHNRTSDKTDEDLNLWNKMTAANASIKYVGEGLLYYRRHKENFNKY
jgi:glycosyltransferase involved in cell wall biosynthesis